MVSVKVKAARQQIINAQPNVTKITQDHLQSK